MNGWKTVVLTGCLVLAAEIASAALLNTGWETDWGAEFGWVGWGHYTRESWRSYMDNDGNLGGTHCGAIHNWDHETDEPNGGWWQDGITNVTIGGLYQASAYLYNDAAYTPSSVELKLEFHNVGGDKINEYVETVTLPGETWELFTVQGAAPDGAYSARLTVAANGQNRTGSLCVDGTSLIAVPEPVSATLLGLGILSVYAVRRKMRK